MFGFRRGLIAFGIDSNNFKMPIAEALIAYVYFGTRLYAIIPIDRVRISWVRIAQPVLLRFRSTSATRFRQIIKIVDVIIDASLIFANYRSRRGADPLRFEHLLRVPFERAIANEAEFQNAD